MKKHILIFYLFGTLRTEAQDPRFYLKTYIHQPAGGKIQENDPEIQYRRRMSLSWGLGVGYQVPVTGKFLIDLSINYHSSRFAGVSNVFSGSSTSIMPLLLIGPGFILVNSEKRTLSAKIGGGIGWLTDFKFVIEGRDTVNNIFLYSRHNWHNGFPGFVSAGVDLRIKGRKHDWGFELAYRHGVTSSYQNIIVLDYPDGRREQSGFVSRLGFVSLGVKYFTRNRERKKGPGQQSPTH